VKPVSELIRFVLAPDGTVVPDLRRRLPGRGVWVTARRDVVAEAERKRVFARGFKGEAKVEPGLADRVEKLTRDAALGALGLARKAGAVVTGFSKVEAAIGKREAAALIEATDGAPEGARKLAQAVRRTYIGENAVPVIRIFPSAELDLALGGANVIHAALLAGRAGEGFLSRAAALAAYLGASEGLSDRN